MNSEVSTIGSALQKKKKQDLVPFQQFQVQHNLKRNIPFGASGMKNPGVFKNSDYFYAKTSLRKLIEINRNERV